MPWFCLRLVLLGMRINPRLPLPKPMAGGWQIGGSTHDWRRFSNKRMIRWRQEISRKDGDELAS
jgi:hypothetical protein